MATLQTSIIKTERESILSRMQEVGWRFDDIQFQIYLLAGKERVFSTSIQEMPNEMTDLVHWLSEIYGKLGKTYQKEKLLKFIITGSY